MRIFRKHRVRKIARILSPLLSVILLLTVLFTAFIYTNVQSSAKEKYYTSILSNLTRIQSSLEGRLDDITLFAKSMVFDTEIERLGTYRSYNQSAIGGATNRIGNYISSVDYISSIYAISAASDNFLIFGNYSSCRIVDKNAFGDKSIFELLLSGVEKFTLHSPSAESGKSTGFAFVGFNGHTGANGPIFALVLNLKHEWMDKIIQGSSPSSSTTVILDFDGTVLSNNGDFARLENFYAATGISSSAFVEAADDFLRFRVKDDWYYAAVTPPSTRGYRVAQLIPVAEIDSTVGGSSIEVLLYISFMLVVLLLITAVSVMVVYRPLADLVKRSNAFESEETKRISAEKSAFLRELFIRSVSNKTDADSIEAKILRLNFKFLPQDRLAYMEIYLDNYAQLRENMTAREWSGFVYAISNVAYEITEARFGCETYIHPDGGNIVLVIFDREHGSPPAKNALWDTAHLICEAVEKSLEVTVSIVFTADAVIPPEIYKSRKKIRRLALSRIVWAEGSVIDADDTYLNISQFNREGMFTMLELLEKNMLSGNSEESCAVIDKIFLAAALPDDISLVWTVLTKVYLEKILLQFPKEIRQSSLKHIENIPSLHEFETSDEMALWLKGVAESCTADIFGYRRSRNYNIVAVVDRVIAENFAEPDLGVAMIAESIGLNASYLSHIYKSRAAGGISDKITSVRLEMACELLKDRSLTTTEVARRCGYINNTGYFYQVFKRAHNITPAQFREQSTNN